MRPSHNFNLTILLLGLILTLIPSTTALPVLAHKRSTSISPRQDIKLPFGISITDLDLADISPIEDGFLELDSDDGDGNDLGSSSVSNANGYLGSEQWQQHEYQFREYRRINQWTIN
ncbi:hypothetical protein ZTR_08985 [Talaromyces verruculosus]|nr:hypothetical protein ZTR_08985 [Talaromyces verruculosus]